jgi:hypothetical protein
VKNFMTCTPQQYCLGDNIKNKVGRIYDMYGGEDMCIQGVWWGKLKEKDHF